MKRISKKKQVLFITISFLLFLHILELGFRVYLHLVNTNTVSNTSKILGNPLIHYMLNPESPSHTSDYFRVTDQVSHAKKFVVCMGGSSTYGFRVSPGDSYPNQLQRFLNAEEKLYKVFNAGVPAWSLPHHISRYIYDLRNRKPRPDIIILYLGFNDASLYLTNPKSLPGHSERLKVLNNEKPLWMHYRSLFWLSGKLESALKKNLLDNTLMDVSFKKRVQLNTINSQNLVRFQNEFDLFLNILKNDTVHILVVLQDTNGNFVFDSTKRAFLLLRDEIKRISLENSVTVVDIHDVTQSKKELFLDVIHMTKKGNKVMAKYLAQVVQKILKQPDDRSDS